MPHQFALSVSATTGRVRPRRARFRPARTCLTPSRFFHPKMTEGDSRMKRFSVVPLLLFVLGSHSFQSSTVPAFVQAAAPPGTAHPAAKRSQKRATSLRVFGRKPAPNPQRPPNLHPSPAPSPHH